LQKEALDLLTKRLKERLEPQFQVEVKVQTPRQPLNSPKH
jgi:hypothetical protein